MTQQKQDKKKKRRNYWAWSTCILLTIALAGSVLSYLESEDIDLICNTTGANLIRHANGTWGCNTISYGELYYHDDTDALTITISDVGTWYVVQNFTTGQCRGITCDENSFTLDKSKNYSIDNTISFTGSANSEYQFSLFVNGAEQEDCEFHRVMGGTATVGVGTFTCITQGDVDEEIDIRVKDNSAPAQNVLIYAMNTNIIEIQ